MKVWDCGVQCYDKQFIAAGGADVEGEYVDTLFLPFYSKADQKANQMLANFVKYTGADKVAGFGVYAWAAGVAFRDAVNAVVKADGVNSVTRANLSTALNNIHKFNADGMFGTIDLAGRKVSPVPRAHSGQERHLRAGEPDEAGHVRLRQEERDPRAARPHQVVRTGGPGALTCGRTRTVHVSVERASFDTGALTGPRQFANVGNDGGDQGTAGSGSPGRGGPWPWPSATIVFLGIVIVESWAGNPVTWDSLLFFLIVGITFGSVYAVAADGPRRHLHDVRHLQLRAGRDRDVRGVHLLEAARRLGHADAPRVRPDGLRAARRRSARSSRSS